MFKTQKNKQFMHPCNQIIRAYLDSFWLFRSYHFKQFCFSQIWVVPTLPTQLHHPWWFCKSSFKETYTKESQTAAEKWKTLENDEQSLEQLKDDLEKMEHERNQINQDKIACRDKLDKGRKLIDELAGESTSWKKELTTIAEEFEHLLGNILVYAASICLLPAFHADKRYCFFNRKFGSKGHHCA